MKPHIRLATEDDADQVQEIYSPIVLDTFVSFETVEPSVNEMRVRMRETRRLFPWLVYMQDERIAGYAYADRHRARAAYQWSVDVSVYVHSAYRRLGIGRALYSSLFKILAEQGFYNAHAGIALPNPASVGLHESIGFVRVAVFKEVGFKAGAWRDVGWWHLALRPKEPNPSPPKGIGALLSTTTEGGLISYGVSPTKAGV